ncbi:fructokinase-1 [Gastrolobium bilobum]|uniref:fructokinase-1 n=1 Tax=Gastrolobium bilobum TaxID=150636 RepID=UPI002AB1A9CE|nr:fructokinase-1 [Gastrolobium bilobum]
MPLPSKALKSPIPLYANGHSFKSHPKPGFIHFYLNRRLANPNLNPSNVIACKGLEIAVPKPVSPSTGSKLTSVGAKHVDVATLGNLCVDIVLNVPQLPPSSLHQRKALMERLASSPPDKKYWEAGGNCNMAIAAARLGLTCVSIGHVGNEIYGKFLSDVLHDEGIGMVGMSTSDDIVNSPSASHETLLCWVLVDPLQKHGFCSRMDFSKEPAFHWMSKVSREVKIAIKNSKVMFCNGYGFDELPPGVLLSSLQYAIEVGTSIFFDPGPRGKSLSTGTPEEQRALNQFLRMSDVLLLTSDEAESLTGIGDPILAGQELLKRGIRTKWVIVKMGSRGSILITASSIACAPAFKVDVIDTVGCGDSFVAAIAYGFIHNMPMVNTLAIANAVGAATAMGCGAGRNVATLEKVVDILRSSNLSEDGEFWTDILEKNVVAQEIICLSNVVMNGNRNYLNLVPFDKVASDLLANLEFPQTVENVPTS